MLKPVRLLKYSKLSVSFSGGSVENFILRLLARYFKKPCVYLRRKCMIERVSQNAEYVFVFRHIYCSFCSASDSF